MRHIPGRLHGLAAALGRAVVGAFSGLVIAFLILLLFVLHPEREPIRSETLAAVVAGGAVLGAYLAAVGGSREIRGKARHVALGGVYGALAGLVASFPFAAATKAAVVMLGGIAGGAALGIAAGRALYGGRWTVGEILIGITVAALACAVIAHWNG